MLSKKQIKELQSVLETNQRELREEREALEQRRLRLSEPEVEYEERGRKDEEQIALEQQERLARDKLKEVNDALQRIGAGTYGQCESCGGDISPKRLEAIPWTRHCINCVEEGPMEPGAPKTEETEPMRASVDLPYRFQGMTDEALAAAVRDELLGDGRVETVELEITVRDRQVILGGTLPSDRQHALLLSLVEDTLGLQVAEDDIRVDRIAFQRRDRAPGKEDFPPRPEEVMLEGEPEPENPYLSVREGAETSPADKIVPEKETK